MLEHFFFYFYDPGCVSVLNCVFMMMFFNYISLLCVFFLLERATSSLEEFLLSNRAFFFSNNLGYVEELIIELINNQDSLKKF